MIPQLGTIWPEVKWSRFWPSRLDRVLAEAQPEHPIRVTTPLRVITPACTIGSIKGRVAGLSVVVFPAQRSSSADSAFVINSPTESTFLTASSLTPPTHLILYPFLHPLLQTLPKVLPSRLTVAPQSLDRRLAAQSASKQETTHQLSGKYRPPEHSPKTYWWRGRSIVQGIERPLASSPLLFLLMNSSSSGCVFVRACHGTCPRLS